MGWASVSLRIDNKAQSYVSYIIITMYKAVSAFILAYHLINHIHTQIRTHVAIDLCITPSTKPKLCSESKKTVKKKKKKELKIKYGILISFKIGLHFVVKSDVALLCCLNTQSLL